MDAIADFTVPAEDRNRTSPFPYGGNRFEFRAVGSTQNVSMVNTVLCALVADSFKAFSEEIEKGTAPIKVSAQCACPAITGTAIFLLIKGQRFTLICRNCLKLNHLDLLTGGEEGSRVTH